MRCYRNGSFLHALWCVYFPGRYIRVSFTRLKGSSPCHNSIHAFHIVLIYAHITIVGRKDMTVIIIFKIKSEYPFKYNIIHNSIIRYNIMTCVLRNLCGTPNHVPNILIQLWCTSRVMFTSAHSTVAPSCIHPPPPTILYNIVVLYLRVYIYLR